ncbi:MAG TPA: M23 family metallopeptidase [Polyangia bacterium]|nr:M23 family metallopeptidase [Polyangia bacterium]
MLRWFAHPFTALLMFTVDLSTSTVLAAPTCARSDLAIAGFPLGGVAGRDWVITNYVDLDPGSPGVTDYAGGRGPAARTYDGHDGIDVDVPSFRDMDSDAAVVYAVAPGVVEEVIQDQPDRHLRCAGRWNLIAVRHANGFRVLYGHLKTGSARVVAGQAVAAGAPLAVVGSSGCSTQPHLHLEVRDCGGAAVDTLAEPTLWIAPPPYDPASGVLDLVVSPGAGLTVAQIKDPARDPAVIAAPTVLGVGLSAAVRGGDAVSVALRSPRGRTTTRSFTIAPGARFGHWYLGFTFLLAATPGTWTVAARINGAGETSRHFDVPPPGVSPRPATARAAPCSRRSSTTPAGGSRPRTARSRPAF